MDAKELARIIAQSNSTDLQALITAKENAKRAMLENASRENVAAFERARRALESAAGEAAQPAYKNRKAALEALKREGYKIAKSKLYNDVKSGLLRMQADGRILEKDLEAYARKSRLVKPEALAEDEKSHGMQITKAKREIEKLEEQILKLRLERETLEGKHISREEFVMEMAARAAALDAGLRHMIRSRLADWIELVKGDSASASLLYEAMNADVDRRLNEYARMGKFQVIVSEEK